MQLGFSPWWLARVVCAAALMAGVSACNKGNAAGAGGAADSRSGGKAGSYGLVTQTRPEAPEKYFPHERRAYALCAEVAQHTNAPVKPFPVLPPDFVSERSTYASDGSRTVVRKVMYTLDGEATPENGCELRLARSARTDVVSNGQQRSADQAPDGQVYMEETEAPPKEPVRASRLAAYATAKRVNGVALKCSTDGVCIVDPDLILVADGPRPVQAASRIDDARTHGTVLVTEPVSLAVGKPVDPALFSLEKGN